MADFISHPTVLQNEIARLEPLQLHHFNALLPIAMEPLLWQFTSAQIETTADFERYFTTALAERNEGISYPFAIFDQRTQQYAGCTRLGNIALAHKRVEIGWTWYGSAFQGTGLNKACKFLLLQFGFENLQLNRIELKTSALNKRSQAAIKKIGATEEGTLRRHMIAENGTVRDTVYFGIIREEWPAIKESIFTDFL